MNSPLPRQVRPQHGETAERFVHRLAHANHLRPTYLRGCLTQSGGPGPIRLEELAALTGRTPANLTRLFPELAPRHRTPGRARDTAAKKAKNDQRKRQLFASIIADVEAGMSQRAIATKRHVSRQTIRKALHHQSPPPRKKIHRRPAVLHDLARHIDAMLQAEPTVKTIEIWQRLHDKHDATPSYPAIRAYVSTHRLAHRQT
jgi:transposase